MKQLLSSEEPFDLTWLNESDEDIVDGAFNYKETNILEVLIKLQRNHHLNRKSKHSCEAYDKKIINILKFTKK